MTKILRALSLSLLFSPLVSFADAPLDGTQSIDFYQKRYELKDDYVKRVDNYGNGFEALYGVRNFRAVLNGVVYRGGSNNAYNKHGKRANMNPLPMEGLKNLCEEGFATAVYLYSTNYSSHLQFTNCQSLFGSKNKLEYLSLPPLGNPNNTETILHLVYERLMSRSSEAPIYLHCWNGWHASGYISAVILKQFCGFTGSQAVSYWDLNTDGNDVGKNYDEIRTQIHDFTPNSSMQISESLRSQVCPSP